MKSTPLAPALRAAVVLAGIVTFGLREAPAQTGGTVFNAPKVVASDEYQFRALTDFSGDGVKDLVSVWWLATVTPSSPTYDLRVTGWRNDGAGNVARTWTRDIGPIPAPQGPTAKTVIVPGRLDADGRGDFVLTIHNIVGYWLGAGGATAPSIPWGLTEPSYVLGALLIDVDADGLDDLVLANQTELKVYLTRVGQPPLLASTLPHGITGDLEILSGEIDGDGSPDVILVRKGPTSTIRLVPIINGALQSGGQVFPFAGVSDPLTTAGDVDGDADCDIVVFRATGGVYQVIRRTGPTAFAVEAPVVGGPATNLVDIDLDGDLDGLCCSGGGPSPPPPYYNLVPSMFEYAINDGSGAFAPAIGVPSLGASRLAGAADMDGDGDVDWVAGRCIHFARSQTPPGPSYLGTVVDSARTVFDLEDDGDPDFQSPLGSCLRNDGAGGFANVPMTLPPPPAGSAFAGPGCAGDFDQDGVVDLIVERRSGTSALIEMRFLKGTHGGFVDGGPAAAPGVDMGTILPSLTTTLSTAITAVADLDGDGDDDLVLRATFAANSPYASVLWFNDGNGFFSSPLLVAGVDVKIVYDVDRDGRPDLIGFINGGFGWGSLGFMRGLGGGAFQTPGLPPWQIYSNFVSVFDDPALGDVNDDGSPELILPDGLVYFLAPDGSVASQTVLTPGILVATLPPSTTFPWERRAFLADVDGDGASDVVVSRLLNGTNATWTWLRTAPGVFAAPVTQIARTRALADLDGDGDLDSLGASSAVRNTRFSGGSAGVRVQFGQPTPGTGGMSITLGAAGSLRVGEPAEIRMRGVVGGATGVYVAGLSPLQPPAFGGLLLVDPAFVLPVAFGGIIGAPGSGDLTIPLTYPPSTAGVALFSQVGVVDPGSAAGIATSNALVIVPGS